MLKSFFLIITLFGLMNVYGQKTELGVSFNSGLFSFSGNSVKNGYCVKNGWLGTTCYADIPYGAKKGLGDGLSVTLKRITKRHFIWGLDLGYESMKSREFIDSISLNGDPANYGFPATGTAFMRTNLFNIFPYIGKRIVLKKISIDIDAGIEFGLINTSNESGSVNAQSQKYTVHSEMSHALIKTDFRTRLQVGVNYHRYGAYLGYSWGQSDYSGGSGGGCSPDPQYPVDPMVNYKYYSRIIRFGVSYKIF
jgi:hypothetical protein